MRLDNHEEAYIAVAGSTSTTLSCHSRHVGFLLGVSKMLSNDIPRRGYLCPTNAGRQHCAKYFLARE